MLDKCEFCKNRNYMIQEECEKCGNSYSKFRPNHFKMFEASKKLNISYEKIWEEIFE